MRAKKITLQNNQVEIQYIEKGQGEISLLFIHGWCIDKSYWSHQIDYFSKQYHVYALDLPGFGGSKAEREEWSIEAYSEDIKAFIHELKMKNIVVIGHSMAGEIMLQTALSNNPNIIGIVGIDNFKLIDVVFPKEQLEQFDEFFEMLKKDFKNTAPQYADMALFSPTTTQEVKDRVKRDFSESDSHVGYETCMKQMEFLMHDAPKLEKLNYKLHLIHSDATPTNIEGLNDHCKENFNIEVIPATGHYPMIEKPEAFNMILEKILLEITTNK
ncbi:alpha/beta hydrolase [Halosquirtibacter laminarini]|uniref:Alpha/beta hydrolase n=1 Tax=Halosquirtibacter laminarini TaxID=3374600 RepID=A0AC61NH53_9BACT|nr:alpha/beta hydrolase [Prolixibacteraceae bacterium]